MMFDYFEPTAELLMLPLSMTIYAWLVGSLGSFGKEEDGLLQSASDTTLTCATLSERKYERE